MNSLRFLTVGYKKKTYCCARNHFEYMTILVKFSNGMFNCVEKIDEDFEYYYDLSVENADFKLRGTCGSGAACCCRHGDDLALFADKMGFPHVKHDNLASLHGNSEQADLSRLGFVFVFRGALSGADCGEFFCAEKTQLYGGRLR